MDACMHADANGYAAKQEQSDEISCVRAEKKIDFTNMTLPLSPSSHQR